LYHLPRSGEPVVGRKDPGMLLLPCLMLLLSAAPAPAQPPDPELLQRYSQSGERALAEHRYEDAEKAYEKLRELSPGTAEVHAGLGLIYYQQRKYTQAVPALRQAMKLNPALPKTDILLALCLSELGQYKEALPGLRKAFKQTADDPLRRLAGLQLTRAYTGLEQDDKAVEVSLELTRLYPKDPEVLYHSGRLFSNYAYLLTMTLARVAPASAWMHQAAGEANESQGLHDPAIREYRQVLALDPGRPGIHFRLGRVLLSRAKAGAEAEAPVSRAEAAKEFEEELRLDPTNANAAYERGEMHRQAGQLEEARELFETAVKHYPDFEEAQVALGRVLVVLEKPDLALSHLKKAVALNPANELPYYQLSLVYRALGNVAEQQKALAEYQRLKSEKASQQEPPTFVFGQVTKQELDSRPQQP
jgi:tetratricopeptide (TPR) repeat protein